MYEDDGKPGECNIVCGPPGSGKTTFVSARMQPGDLVLDLDRLFAAISFQPLYGRINEKNLLGYALAARDGIIDKAILHGSRRPNFWFIVGGASPSERQRWQEIFQAKVHVLAIPQSVCVQRLEASGERKHQVSRMKEVIANWWHEYEPRHEFETTYDR